MFKTLQNKSFFVKAGSVEQNISAALAIIGIK